MKKFSFLFVSLLLLAGAVYATAPSYTAVDGVYEWSRDTIISSDAAYDTLVGAADSATLVTLRKFEPGWEYILVRDAITGGGTDSLKVQLSLRCFDENSALLYTVAVDSITAAPGEAILLPVGGSAFGMKYTLKYKAYTDNGGEVINNRISIWKRRPITITKSYR